LFPLLPFSVLDYVVVLRGVGFCPRCCCFSCLSSCTLFSPGPPGTLFWTNKHVVFLRWLTSFILISNVSTCSLDSHRFSFFLPRPPLFPFSFFFAARSGLVTEFFFFFPLTKGVVPEYDETVVLWASLLRRLVWSAFRRGNLKCTFPCRKFPSSLFTGPFLWAVCTGTALWCVCVVPHCSPSTVGVLNWKPPILPPSPP